MVSGPRLPRHVLELFLGGELSVKPGLAYCSTSMFAVDSQAQDMWVGDDTQGDSIASSVSGPSRSDFENFTSEHVGRRKVTPSGASSTSNGKPSSKTLGVIRTGDIMMRHRRSILPHEKAFSIQIGCKLFKLSGASINSDGKLVFSDIGWPSLKSLEYPRISQDTSKSSCDYMKMTTGQQRRCSSTEIQILSRIYVDIYKVQQSNWQFLTFH